MKTENLNLFSKNLEDFLYGGFAAVVPLLREFHYNKTHIVLEGLHFSAYSLLVHMHKRQEDLLKFMRDPRNNPEVWNEAYWPKKYKPKNEKVWNKAIQEFEANLLEMINLIKVNSNNIFESQSNKKSLFWAACTNFQHNAYHIGQLKTIGRQLGVW